MEWKKHSNLEGAHAFMGASKYSWLNYNEEKLTETYLSSLAVERGTRIHALACEHIRLGIPIPLLMPEQPETLNLYVNDAIGFRMEPEVVLYYSDNCFGTADAISCRIERKISIDREILRIHDLKTGKTPASFKQLDIYAALFCLEYQRKPEDLIIEERIYQHNEIAISKPEAKDIKPIMEKIRRFDEILNKLREERA